MKGMLLLAFALCLWASVVLQRGEPPRSHAEGRLAWQMQFCAGLLRDLACENPAITGSADFARVFASACSGRLGPANALEQALVAHLDRLDCALGTEILPITGYLTRQECLLVPGQEAQEALSGEASYQALKALDACGLFLVRDLEERVSEELWEMLRGKVDRWHVAILSKRWEPLL